MTGQVGIRTLSFCADCTSTAGTGQVAQGRLDPTGQGFVNAQPYCLSAEFLLLGNSLEAFPPGVCQENTTEGFLS